VSAYWLTYRRNGDLVGVVIIEASSLITARMWAALDQLDQGATFSEGHTLEYAMTAALPAGTIGRMLTPAEATQLLHRLAPGSTRDALEQSGARRRWAAHVKTHGPAPSA
jgi:hypothetical protein